MAWTEPRTWTTLELVTASLMNTHLRDNLNALRLDLDNFNAVRLLDRQVSEQEVINTSSETTVYSFTVPGGTLGTENWLRMTLIGWYKNQSGGSANLTPRVKFGGTTFTSATLGGFSSSANYRHLRITAELFAANSESSQIGVGRMWMGLDGSATNNALGASEQRENSTSISVNSASNANLVVTMQHSVANSNITVIVKSVFLERLV